MPNIQSVLKAEVTRLVRKELKVELDALRQSVGAQRAEIGAMKRRIAELEKAAKNASRELHRAKARVTAPEATDEMSSGLRFRAAGMASNRKRLGLSAADFGLLVSATGQSVYAWERGRTKPDAKHLEAIASLRGIGKREAEDRLAALKQAS